MKLLFLALALCALISLVQLAPTPSGSNRELILPQYDEEEIPAETPANEEDDDDDEDEDDEVTTTTTTTTTTRATRSSFRFPTRNPNFIPSRRTVFPTRTSSSRTTMADDEDDAFSTDGPNYNGDYHYFADFHKHIRKIIEEIQKFIQRLAKDGLSKTIQRMSDLSTMDD